MIEHDETRDFGFASTRWPGLPKLIEECGEVVQIAAKLLTTNGEREYWSDVDLYERMQEELGDLLAIVEFVISNGPLDANEVDRRYEVKHRRFLRWRERASL